MRKHKFQCSTLVICGICFLAIWLAILLLIAARLGSGGSISRFVRRIRDDVVINTKAEAKALAMLGSKIGVALMSQKDRSAMHNDVPLRVERSPPRHSAALLRRGGLAQGSSSIETMTTDDGVAADAIPQTSTIHCVMWGTFTEACYYTDVCFEPVSRTLLLMGDEESVSSTGYRTNTYVK